MDVLSEVLRAVRLTGAVYTIRAKYAYLQYDAPKFSNGAAVTGRIGILQNVVIEHTDSFWPRYLSQAATERAGFFWSRSESTGVSRPQSASIAGSSHATPSSSAPL